MQQTTEELQLRIRELDKEIKRLHKAVKEQRYGLHWLDVPEAFEAETENKIPILEEVKDKAIVNDDGKPTHILIEGDNYHALTCLNYTHKGKVDVIYIDPPYNTGSDGFKYKDKRVLNEFPDGTPVPKDHPLRHSYWLSFMSKRLELAHKLLNDDGFIVISIDDNESAQLKFLCDSIFGISNHIMNFFVQVRYAGKTLVEDMEYQKLIEQVLIYRKTPKGKLLKEKNKYSIEKFEWNIKTEVPNEIIELGGKKVEIFKPGNYKIVKEKANENLLKEIWATGKILDGNSSGRFFRDYIIDRKSGDGLNTLYKVYGIGDDKFDYRFFTGPKRANATKGKYFQGVPIDIYNNLETHNKEKVIVNFADFADSFGNCRHEGGVEFRSGKKPIAFLNSLFKLLLNPKKENILLDFFAGSGSSAHSLLSLNQEFNQNNQFVLVTNNENKIMDDFCYPRIKNILNGWGENNGYGNSLKYYHTTFVGKNNPTRANDTDKVELSHKAGYLLALSENTLNETATGRYYQMFENENCATAIYFQEDLSEIDQFVASVAQNGKHTAVYIFSWSNGEEFLPMFDHLPNVAIKTIPQPILEIYRSINK
jgi:adenine-specific DNA-methyltransferase